MRRLFCFFCQPRCTSRHRGRRARTPSARPAAARTLLRGSAVRSEDRCIQRRGARAGGNLSGDACPSFSDDWRGFLVAALGHYFCGDAWRGRTSVGPRGTGQGVTCSNAPRSRASWREAGWRTRGPRSARQRVSRSPEIVRDARGTPLNDDPTLREWSTAGGNRKYYGGPPCAPAR